MARNINRLTDKAVRALKEPGLHADGAGLYLRIDQTLSKRWVFIFHLAGKRREMGLGSGVEVSLKDARISAGEAARLVRLGQDPIAARKLAGRAPETTLQVLDDLLSDLKGGWKSEKHGKQWKTMLENHAGAILAMPVAQVQTEHVLKALRPIWTAKPVTARKVRERLERVFDAAKVRSLRDGENPARWRGHLDALLARGKPAATHHAAMAYDDLPAFMVELSSRDSMSARALRWTILTAARTGETIGAPWSEIEGDLWVIPKERMKMDRPHRVPLTEAAKACLPERGGAGDFIFVGGSKVGGLSNMAMAELLKGMRPGLTVHGFRSTFRDWAGDRTAFQREVIEAALAHQVGDEVERAYRRSDALEKRRELMEAWERFCTTEPGANVLQFKGAG